MEFTGLEIVCTYAEYPVSIDIDQVAGYVWPIDEQEFEDIWRRWCRPSPPGDPQQGASAEARGFGASAGDGRFRGIVSGAVEGAGRLVEDGEDVGEG